MARNQSQPPTFATKTLLPVALKPALSSTEDVALYTIWAGVWISLDALMLVPVKVCTELAYTLLVILTWSSGETNSTLLEEIGAQGFQF